MWHWEYPMEYVFYGMATIAIWTIINLFIKITYEREEEEMDEFEPSDPRETINPGEYKEREIQEVHAAGEGEGNCTGDTTSYEVEPRKEGPTTGVDAALEDSDGHLEEKLERSLVRERASTGTNMEAEGGCLEKELGEGPTSGAKPEVECSDGDLLTGEVTGDEPIDGADQEAGDPDFILEKETRWEKAGEGSKVIENLEREGSDSTLEDDRTERIKPVGQVEEILDREGTKPECFGEDEKEVKGPVDLLVFGRKADVPEDVPEPDLSMNAKEVEEEVSDSLMDCSGLVFEVVREDDEHRDKGSSGYENLAGDPPSVAVRGVSPSFEDEECNDTGENLYQEQSSEVDNEIPEGTDISAVHAKEESQECINPEAGVGIPKIFIIDELAQSPREFHAEEEVVFYENDTNFAPEGEEEQKNVGKEIGDVMVKERSFSHGSSNRPDLDADEEISFSEEREHEGPGEVDEKSTPSDEYRYAQIEEDVAIAEEQTHPITEELKTQSLSFQEEGNSLHTGESEDAPIEVGGRVDSHPAGIIASPRAKETPVDGGEGIEDIFPKDVGLTAHRLSDRPHLDTGEEDVEVERQMGCVNGRGSDQGACEAGSEIPVGGGASGADHARLGNHKEQPIIASDGGGEVDPIERGERREVTSGGGGGSGLWNGDAPLPSGTADGHVKPGAPDQAGGISIVGITGFSGRDVEKSSAVDSEINDGTISLRNHSNAKEPNDQGYAKTSQEEGDKIPSEEEPNTPTFLREDFIKTYMKSKVKIVRPIDSSIFGTVGFYSYEGRNLLKNNCGQEEFQHWVLKQENHGWRVADCSPGDGKLPAKNDFGDSLPEFDGYNSYFETVNRMCKKEQTIDLIAEGFDAEYLDSAVPRIEISEWVSTRAECRSTYELRVKLLSGNKVTISDFQLDHSFSNTKEVEWNKVSHVFKKYGAGARYVCFSHGAVKWFGKYGCRMTGGVVRVVPRRQ